MSTETLQQGERLTSVAPSEYATAPRHATKGRGTPANSPFATQRFAVSRWRVRGNSLNLFAPNFTHTPKLALTRAVAGEKEG